MASYSQACGILAVYSKSDSQRDTANARVTTGFFAGNGLAVVIEEGVKSAVFRQRKRRAKVVIRNDGRREQKEEMDRWYDGIVGRIWWICVLLYTGRNFARGWVSAGLVNEMAGF